MLAEAEKYKEEDEAEAARISAKNGLESYAYSLRNSLSDDKVGDKLEPGDKEKLKKAIDETVEWLDGNNTATKVGFYTTFLSIFFKNKYLTYYRMNSRPSKRNWRASPTLS